MRTLNRPMFNMGGPIKQGIMHGIREPHKDGKIVGGHQSPLLAGAHPWKDKSGREHHLLPAGWAAAAGFARFAPALYRALSAGKNISKAGNIAKNVGGASGAGTGWTGSTALTVIPKETVKKAPGFFKNWWSGDPTVRSAKWLKDAIMSPTAKGLGQKVVKGVISPTGILTSGWLAKSFWPDGTPKDDGSPTGLNKPGGFPGADIPEVRVKSQAEKDAFAKSQREKRVNKYLDMMGYDRSKKMAIADALIDASKIVGDRGSLDPKNITQELISPIIQATSKRLDKPSQIREAVGLMATKAEIEKDLSAETDALAKKLTLAKIKSAEAGLEQTESFEGGMKAFLTLRKGAVAANELEQMARLLANEHNEPFTKVTEETDLSTLDNGIYMSGTKIIRITDGVPQQLV